MVNTHTQRKSAVLVAAAGLSLLCSAALGQYQPQASPVERVLNAEAYIDYQNGIAATGRTAGSLFSAVNNAAEHPATLLPSQEMGVRVAINLDAIEALGNMVDARVTMPCFNNQSLELAFVLEERLGRDTWVWYGQIAGIPGSDVILVYHEGSVGAEIRDYTGKRRYQIRPTPDGGQALYKVKQADLAGPWCGGDGAVLHDPQPVPSGTVNTRGFVSDPINQVDIMTIVTAEARIFYGTEINFYVESLLAVSDFNLRADNSVSDVSLRLVAADWNLAGSYNEGASLGDDLSAMRSNGVLKAALDEARELYRPDVVAMIRQFGVPSPDGGTALGLAYRPFVVSVMSADIAISTNVRGGSLPLVGDIFSHEVGHNFGGAHDFQTLFLEGHTPTPGNFPAVTDSPMGWVVTCEDGCLFDDERWHTTMAYGRGTQCGEDVLLPYFSRPTFTYDAPFPCAIYPLGAEPSGIIGANVGHLLYLTRGYVSDNRNHATLRWAGAPSLPDGGEGTHFNPYGILHTAVHYVQGGPDEAIVRAKSGVFEETQALGGPVIYNNGTRIEAIGGNVVIR